MFYIGKERPKVTFFAGDENITNVNDNSDDYN